MRSVNNTSSNNSSNNNNNNNNSDNNSSSSNNSNNNNNNSNNSSSSNNNISSEHSCVEVENTEELPKGDSSELRDVRWYKSARTCIAFMSALGYTFFYLLRVNLSIAMVFMVSDQPSIISNLSGVSRVASRNRTDTSNFVINNSTSLFNHSIVQSSSATQESISSTNYATFSLDEHPHTTSTHLSTFQTEMSDRIGDVCSEVTLMHEGHEKKYKGEFPWSKETTGYVLSSFFYGYIVTQFPGGWLATRFGTKHIFGGGMFISIVATFLTPLAARSHPYLLIALRAIIGLAHGAGFPATHVLYSLWFPPLERTRYITFSHAGTMAGAIVALSVSGFICDIPIDNGWPFIFYIYGTASLLWFMLWNYFVYDSPLKHPRIDPIERDYIVTKIGPSVYSGVMHRERIPWSYVLRSMPVWAIVVTHLGNNWANYTILVCIPLFMKEVLKFNTKENGVLSSLPYVLSFFVSIGSGQIADLLIRKEILSTTNTRKLFQLLSSGIPAMLLVAIGFIDCRNRYWAVLLLCLIVSINSLCRAGFMVNHVDIAPRYAGLLFGISNTLGTTPGILSPIVVGMLTTTGSREEWVIVFNICAALLVGSCIFYLVFGDGKLQKWSSPSIVEIRTVNGEKTNPCDDGISDRLVTKM